MSVLVVKADFHCSVPQDMLQCTALNTLQLHETSLVAAMLSKGRFTLFALFFFLDVISVTLAKDSQLGITHCCLADRCKPPNHVFVSLGETANAQRLLDF